MRRRHLLLATCVALPLALGAYAQAEAERQLDAAIARARAALGPDDALEWRERSVDPVTGTARLMGVTWRRGGSRLTAEEVTLQGLQDTRIGAATLRAVRLEKAAPANPVPGATKDGTPPAVTKDATPPGGDAGAITVARLSLNGLLLPTRAGGAPGVDWATAAVEGAVAETVVLDMAGKGHVEAARLSLAGYAPGAAGEAVVEGLSFAEPPASGQTRIRLGRARLAGAVLPRPGQDLDPWALAADSAVMEDLEVVVPREDVQFRLGRVQVDGWGEGRLTSAALGDLRLSGTADKSGPFQLALGRLGFSGIAARDIAHAFATEVNPPQSRPGQEQSADLEGLSLSLDNAPLMTIGAIRARNNWDSASPNTEIGTVAVEGIVLDIPAAYGGDWLDGLGYKQIRARLDNAARLGRQDGRLVADPLALQAEAMGTLGFTMDLRGLEMPVPGQPATKAEDVMALAAKWQVAAFTVRYTDDSLLRRVVAQQAAASRTTEARLREQYAQMVLTTPIPGGGKDSPAVTRIRQAWASFARNPGTIEMAVRPPQPVPMMDFLSFSSLPPSDVVRQLNITATATPPAGTPAAPPAGAPLQKPR
jgi:hypothetical protein